MDIEFIKNISFALAAAWVAGTVVRKYRRFFEWEKTDNWQSFIQRVREEQRKDVQAQELMFGSRRATNRANLITFFFLVGLLFLLTSFPEFSMWIIGYLVIGFFVSRRVADDEKTADHERLLFGDRLWRRLYFALAWPFLFFLRKNKNTDT